MATATTRLRFWSYIQPLFGRSSGRAASERRAAPADTIHYRLVVTERLIWHPVLGYRPHTEYHWVPSDHANPEE
jgi:hypothetical protein